MFFTTDLPKDIVDGIIVFCPQEGLALSHSEPYKLSQFLNSAALFLLIKISTVVAGSTNIFN